MSIASDLERYMLELINAERQKAGVQALQLEQNLNESAEVHSSWMIDTDTFSHTGAGGSTARERMEAAGFDFSGSTRSGENIGYQSERGAAGFFDDVEDIHERLMDSYWHRWNIENADYEYVGIGIEIGEYNGFDVVMITQNFAKTDGQADLDTGGGSDPVPGTILGTSGQDYLQGTGSGDIIDGLGNKDTLDGRGGDDALFGGGGNDRLVGGAGADDLFGGNGHDFAAYDTSSTGVTASLSAPYANSGDAQGDSYSSIESLRGSNYSDVLLGDGGGNRLSGRHGSDRLEGYAGDDVIRGGAASDEIIGGAGDDKLFGGNASDVFVFATGSGADVIKDFQDDKDSLDLGGHGYQSVASALAQASESRGDVIFAFSSGDSLVVENTSISQLQDDIIV